MTKCFDLGLWALMAMMNAHIIVIIRLNLMHIGDFDQDLLYSPTHCTEDQGGDDEDVLELKLTNAAFGIFGFISSLNGLGHDSMGLLVEVLSLISSQK